MFQSSDTARSSVNRQYNEHLHLDASTTQSQHATCGPATRREATISRGARSVRSGLRSGRCLQEPNFWAPINRRGWRKGTHHTILSALVEPNIRLWASPLPPRFRGFAGMIAVEAGVLQERRLPSVQLLCSTRHREKCTRLSAALSGPTLSPNVRTTTWIAGAPEFEQRARPASEPGISGPASDPPQEPNDRI